MNNINTSDDRINATPAHKDSQLWTINHKRMKLSDKCSDYKIRCHFISIKGPLWGSCRLLYRRIFASNEGLRRFVGGSGVRTAYVVLVRMSWVNNLSTSTCIDARGHCPVNEHEFYFKS